MNRNSILVVEDNAITRKMFRVALESDGYSVLEASDGRSALALLRAQQVSLVLLDLVLPDINGSDLVHQLRDVWQGLHGDKDLPIIAVSGFFAKATSTDGANRGFTGSLQKPVEPSRLLQTVKAYLPPEEVPNDRLGRGLRVVLADDDVVQAKLLKLQLAQIGFEVRIACDGAEALSMAVDWRPDAIVSDLLMPKMDGFRLCLSVRENAELANTPVLLHSSVFIDEHDRQLAESVGCSAFVARTPDSHALIKTLSELTTAPKSTREWQGGVRQENPPTDAYIQTIIGQIERQVGLNKDLGARLNLLQAHLSLMSEFADDLRNPPTCDEMLQAIIEKSFHIAGLSRGIVYVLETNGTHSLCTSCGFSNAAELSNFFGMFSVLDRVTESRVPIRISSESSPEPDAAILLEKLSANSLVIAPLIVSNRSIGTLVIISDEKHLSDDWNERALVLGAQLGQTMTIVRIMGRVVETCSRLVNSAKFTALGEMAGGIAHEINNPMSIIIGKSRQLCELLESDPIDQATATRARKYSGALTETADRVVRIVNGLRTVSRTSDKDPFVRTKLKTMIADTIALAAGRLKYQSIILTIDDYPANLAIDCRATAIVQLLINLLNNAYDAVEHLPDRWIKLVVQPADEWLELAITDSGPGIPADLRTRIMQPFFTTKEVGRGTGLGLSIAKGIIEDHQGTLSIDENCCNTRFVVRLPMTQEHQ